MQARGRSYRRQIADPLRDGVRLSVTGTSDADVAARVDRIRRAADDLAMGLIDRETAARTIARLACGDLDGAPTIEQLFAAHVATLQPRWAKTSRWLWGYVLAPSFAAKRAHEIDEALVREFDARVRAEGYAQNTAKNAWHLLRAAINRAARDGVIERPPPVMRPGALRGRGVGQWSQVVERPACRSWAEVEALVRSAVEYDADMRQKGRWSDYGPRVALAVSCGLRQGEIGGVCWGDISTRPDGGASIAIYRQVTDGWRRAHPAASTPPDLPKYGRVRRLALSSLAISALGAQRRALEAADASCVAPDAPIFPARLSGSLRDRWRAHADAIRPDVMRVIAERAGLPRASEWSPHCLRHSFATIEALGSQGDWRALQSRTGHADMRTLARYIRSAQDGLALPAQPEAPMLGDDRADVVVGAVDNAAAALDLAVDAASRAQAERRRVAREDRAARRRIEALDGSAFAKLARAWLASPEAQKRAKRPVEVTAWADRRYQAAYHDAMRRQEPRERASLVAKRARAGVLSAWARALERVRAHAATTPSVPPS